MNRIWIQFYGEFPTVLQFPMDENYVKLLFSEKQVPYTSQS